jgi:hypothetical protein
MILHYARLTQQFIWDFAATRGVAAPYAVRSEDRHLHSIVAMRDAYVDLLTPGGQQPSGKPVFRLNHFELELETFQLKQQQLLMQITADRLSEDYVNKLVYEPLQKAIDFATEDLRWAQLEKDSIDFDVDYGTQQRFSDEAQELVALVEERTILLERAQADLIQRKIEIDSQQRRLKAEQDDLKQRLDLDDQIRELHVYVLPAIGVVDFHTYDGAFVKEDDLICTVKFA